LWLVLSCGIIILLLTSCGKSGAYICVTNDGYWYKKQQINDLYICPYSNYLDVLKYSPESLL